jgi:carbonic anhydrase
MKKLIHGIVDFRKKVRPDYREIFAKLALEQKPDSLFIACSDSRVVPNLFASTDPGDLFVLRNVGNLIAPCGTEGMSESDESEAAAIEFSLINLEVKHIIVCGHSDCGAIRAICEGREKLRAPHLRSWLRHGLPADGSAPPKDHNLLSKLNVLQQIENLKSYPLVQERLARKKLSLHAWWFDIGHAEVSYYDPARKDFFVIDEVEGGKITAALED